MATMNANGRRRGIAIAVGTGLTAVAIAATVAAARSGEQDSSWPTVDSAIFEGLPKDVVAEVLANPAAQANVTIYPAGATEDRNTMMQGMVVNFTQCRQMLAAYETWKATGIAPELPPLVLPANPTSDTATTVKLVDDAYRAELASGKIDEVRDDLTNDSGCGDWIPANPGDLSGPTVADEVLGVK